MLDHLGLLQPFQPPIPAQPWADLPAVLDLAHYDNVSIKVSGACTLSHEPFPFADIWPPIEEVIAAFGLQRCMWGTDWTRAIEVVTAADAVRAFTQTDRLSDSDRAQLMGETAATVYNWRPRSL